MVLALPDTDVKATNQGLGLCCLQQELVHQLHSTYTAAKGMQVSEPGYETASQGKNLELFMQVTCSRCVHVNKNCPNHVNTAEVGAPIELLWGHTHMHGIRFLFKKWNRFKNTFLEVK